MTHSMVVLTIIDCVFTGASSGSVTTQYFGEQFDTDMVETGPLSYDVYVYPQSSVRNNTNVTLHLDVEKVSLEDLSSGKDGLSVPGTRVREAFIKKTILLLTFINKDFPPPP